MKKIILLQVAGIHIVFLLLFSINSQAGCSNLTHTKPDPSLMAYPVSAAYPNAELYIGGMYISNQGNVNGTITWYWGGPYETLELCTTSWALPNEYGGVGDWFHCPNEDPNRVTMPSVDEIELIDPYHELYGHKNSTLSVVVTNNCGLDDYVASWEFTLSMPDSDSDGMLDDWEVDHGLNPNEDDSLGDLDSDGLNNLYEFQNGSNPMDPLEPCSYIDYLVINPSFSASSSINNDRVVVFDSSQSACFEMVSCVRQERDCSDEWNFGGSGSIVGGNGDGIIVYLYDAAGDYTASLTMTESSSGTSATKSLSVTAAIVEPPIPDVDFTTNVIEGGIVILKSQDIPANIVTAKINWADRGSTTIDLDPTPQTAFSDGIYHTYGIGSTYRIGVRLTDNDGNNFTYTYKVTPISFPNDFNGDGKQDILLRSESSGKLRLFIMNGSEIISDTEFADPGVSWEVAGIADFNGDRKADILFRHAVSGEVWLYQMDGNTITASNRVVNNVGLEWQIVSLKDFNGDGNADILWRRSTDGVVWLYQMDGYTIIANSGVRTVPLVWQIVGLKDFNGDGNTDILWRSDDWGQLYIYLMNGNTIFSEGSVASPNISWKVAGTDDFNGDAKADILIRNDDTGQLWMYEMDGSTVTSSNLVTTNPGVSWGVVGVKDFNDNYKSDILIRKTDGTLRLFTMSGFQVLANDVVEYLSTDWTIVDLADFNGDQISDILLHKNDGSLRLFIMNGSQVVANEHIKMLDLDWVVQ